MWTSKAYFINNIKYMIIYEYITYYLYFYYYFINNYSVCNCIFITPYYISYLLYLMLYHNCIITLYNYINILDINYKY